MAKRKRNGPGVNIETGVAELPGLKIQAYEADLVRDRPNLAESVERRGERGGLIRWGEEDVWVDRYDARLLLSPPLASSSHDPSLVDDVADVGWSSLPSDSEDTFFLTRQEVGEYEHEKRKREMEQGRLDRLKAMDELEGVVEEQGEEWGGSDEEPDEAQTNLMTRTATHMLASPNPTQLEMRILANHGADPRFAFLRGRWKRTWARIKIEAGGTGNKGDSKSGIGGLAGYASESESSTGDQGKTEVTDEEEREMERVKAERRARAHEWMRKRREGV